MTTKLLLGIILFSQVFIYPVILVSSSPTDKICTAPICVYSGLSIYICFDPPPTSYSQHYSAINMIVYGDGLLESGYVLLSFDKTVIISDDGSVSTQFSDFRLYPENCTEETKLSISIPKSGKLTINQPVTISYIGGENSDKTLNKTLEKTYLFYNALVFDFILLIILIIGMMVFVYSLYYTKNQNFFDLRDRLLIFNYLDHKDLSLNALHKRKLKKIRTFIFTFKSSITYRKFQTQLEKDQTTKEKAGFQKDLQKIKTKIESILNYRQSINQLPLYKSIQINFPSVIRKNEYIKKYSPDPKILRPIKNRFKNTNSDMKFLVLTDSEDIQLIWESITNYLKDHQKPIPDINYEEDSSILLKKVQIYIKDYHPKEKGFLYQERELQIKIDNLSKRLINIDKQLERYQKLSEDKFSSLPKNISKLSRHLRWLKNHQQLSGATKLITEIEDILKLLQSIEEL